MARYFGKIGYQLLDETKPGKFMEDIIERDYFGDEVRNSSRWETSNLGSNDDLNIQNTISIVADAFAYQNAQRIRYATYMGQKWKVKTVEIARPRLILALGGVYNEQILSSSEEVAPVEQAKWGSQTPQTSGSTRFVASPDMGDT